MCSCRIIGIFIFTSLFISCIEKENSKFKELDDGLIYEDIDSQYYMIRSYGINGNIRYVSFFNINKESPAMLMFFDDTIIYNGNVEVDTNISQQVKELINDGKVSD